MAFFSNDSYVIDDDDDDSSECQSSSEDEIEMLLRGIPQQKKRLKLLESKPDKLGFYGEQKPASSSEDEFEKEMNAELNQQIRQLEKERVSTQKELEVPSSSRRSKNDKQSSEIKGAYYDDVYFDSDEEDDTGMKSHHAVLSNDDLLYDPAMDDKDQNWVDRQRRKHCSSTLDDLQAGRGKKAAKKPSSDALLDCPACLTTVCIDCQRHDSYKNQYRAMFVMNCIVDHSEQLQCPEQQSSKKKKKPDTLEQTSSTEPSSSDLFHPVRCSECNTVIGVVDEDEIYHFFNIIASHT